MKSAVVGIAAVGIVLGVLHGAVAGETVYVRSLRATLLSEPRVGAPPVGEVAKGAALEVTGRVEGWVRVRRDTGEGWLPVLLVGDAPPPARVSLLEGSAGTLHETARRRASQVVTAGASRGLVARDAAGDPGDPADYDALRTLEGFAPTEGELDRFLRLLQER
ncbi:MAG: hypothetical protein Kow0092_29790 [Deferrisomatales bacterium]